MFLSPGCLRLPPPTPSHVVAYSRILRIYGLFSEKQTVTILWSLDVNALLVQIDFPDSSTLLMVLFDFLFPTPFKSAIMHPRFSNLPFLLYITGVRLALYDWWI